jgi:hypothetical protein
MQGNMGHNPKIMGM